MSTSKKKVDGYGCDNKTHILFTGLGYDTRMLQGIGVSIKKTIVVTRDMDYLSRSPEFLSKLKIIGIPHQGFLERIAHYERLTKSWKGGAA